MIIKISYLLPIFIGGNMKNSKKNLYLLITSVIASIVMVFLSINSQYPDGLGMDRVPFDYAWFDVYIYTSSTFLVAATLILITSCKGVHDLYHSGMIKNMLQREKFNNIKKSILANTWLSGFFFYPVFLILTYIVCFIVFPTKGVGINLATDGPMYNSLLILLKSCIITIIYSTIISNVTLIVSKKIKNFAVATILSFIIILIYSVISQLIFPKLLKAFFSEQFAKGFDLINGLIFGFGSIISILIHGFILVIITTLILNKIYNNPNEVVLNYENEN